MECPHLFHTYCAAGGAFLFVALCLHICPRRGEKEEGGGHLLVLVFCHATYNGGLSMLELMCSHSYLSTVLSRGRSISPLGSYLYRDTSVDGLMGSMFEH